MPAADIAPAPPPRYAVVGRPVAHSRSPAIHARFAQTTGRLIDYTRIEAPPDAFLDTLRRFEQAGGRGCNVTLPFKLDAFEACARLTDRARHAGAVNTIAFGADGWHGDNTDGAGLVQDIGGNAGVSLAGARVLLLGAGGAAAGALGPLLDARPAEVVLVNRTASRAEALAARHAVQAAAHGVVLQARPATAPGAGFDVLINATAASLEAAVPPLPADGLAPGALALDMMYGPAAAPFLDWARQRGAVARDGLGMLVEQAAAAFDFWFGVRPDTFDVLAELRLAVDGEAGR